MGIFNWFRPQAKGTPPSSDTTPSGNGVSRNVMVSVMEDTLEERNKALRLAAENQHLAAIVQQSEEGIVQLSPDGKVVNLNKSAEQFFGKAIDHQTEHNFIDLFKPEDHIGIQAALTAILKKHAVKPVTLYKKSADSDNYSVFELKFSALYDASDDIFSIVVVIRDISSQHRQQEELRLIIEQAPNALIMADQDGQIVVTNGQVEQLFGYEKGELVGQSVEILVPDNIRPFHPELRAKFLRSPEARAMGAGRDLTARRKDGSEVAVEIGLNPIQTKTGHFVVASVVDITERKRSQQVLESINLKLQQKNQEMEQFIYTVSHDLKSPLVTIGGFAQRLRASLQDTLNDKQTHQLNRIEASIHHMESLLNDLLSLSRVIHRDIDKQELDTNNLITSVLEQLEESIDNANASIQVIPNLPTIYGNERLVAQCLQNLVANAIQYRDPDRPLTVAIDVQDQGTSRCLTVSDNGVGIEAQYFERIFRIFERLNIGQGTGVGLAIVKTIVERHGGKIDLQSQPGAGSTFSLTFPNSQPDEYRKPC